MDTIGRMPNGFLNCIITSPPYWGLRDYGTDGQVWPEISYSPMPGLPKITVPSQVCQLGLEQDPESYVAHLVYIFQKARRVLQKDGTFWLNLADSYTSGGRKSRDPGQSKLHPAFTGEHNGVTSWRPDTPSGLKKKDLVGIPWRIALALQADGWYLRSDIIWHKLNPMPESVTDRPTKAHEYVFLFSKSEKYYYDYESVKEPVAESTKKRGKVSFGGAKGRNYTPKPDDPNFRNGSEQWGREFDYKKSCKNGLRNRRSVWTMANEPYKGAHYAVFPTKLVEPCLLAGCPSGGVVYDPFGGSGTTAVVAEQHGRNWIISEISQRYVENDAKARIEKARL